MKSNVLYMLLFFFVVITYGCEESIYSDVDDTHTQVSKQDKLDFDFVNGKCAPVIAYYDGVDSTGAALSRDDAFKYINAILQCGGFDVMRGVDMINNTNTSDVYDLAASMLGVSSATANVLADMNTYYSKAVNICRVRQEIAKRNNTVLDDSTATVCGFAGMVGSVSNISLLVGSITGKQITISEEGFKEALNGIDVNSTIDDFLEKAENDAYLDNLTEALNTAFDGMTSMEDILSGSESMVNDVKSNLFDENDKTSSDKLKSYLESMKNNSNKI